MAETYGTSKFRYQYVDGWGKLPSGWSYRECPGVAVDSKERPTHFAGIRQVAPTDFRERLTEVGNEMEKRIPHKLLVALLIFQEPFAVVIPLQFPQEREELRTEIRLLWH